MLLLPCAARCLPCLTLIGVSLVVFGLVRLALGDPIGMLMPPEALPDVIAQTKAAYGFGKPLYMQDPYAGGVLRRLKHQCVGSVPEHDDGPSSLAAPP